MMSACVFCDILAGESPASVVFRDELCCTFMDIQPVNPGHVSRIPHAFRAWHGDSRTFFDWQTGGLS